jgi:hypothetical protein
MHITKASILGWVKTRTKLIAGVSVGVVVGAAGAAVVNASIPAANGTIYACYTTNNTSFLARVRIIDNSTQTCNTSETAINWNQQGPAGPTGPQGPAGPTGPEGPAGDSANVAYGIMIYDANTDTYNLTNSHNVTSAVHRLDADNKPGYCITVNFTPKNAMIDRATNNVASPTADTKDASGTWLLRGTDPDPCSDLPSTNVWVAASGYFLVH